MQLGLVLMLLYDYPTIRQLVKQLLLVGYRSVIQQMKRPEIRALLRPDLIFSDHCKLRLAVVDFIKAKSKISYIYINMPIINFYTLYDETEGNDLAIYVLKTITGLGTSF